MSQKERKLPEATESSRNSTTPEKSEEQMNSLETIVVDSDCAVQSDKAELLNKPASNSFSYGANFEFVVKDSADKKAYGSRLSNEGAFRRVEGTLEDLAVHIGEGLSWMPAVLDEGKPRNKENANYAELLAVDIDNKDPSRSITIEEAQRHPFIAAHCALGIESTNSTPEHHKLRLVFRLAKPIEGVEAWKRIRLLSEYLMKVVLPGADNTHDPSRFYYGGFGREPFLLNEGAWLPDDFVEKALAWEAELERQKKERLDARQAKTKPVVPSGGVFDIADLVSRNCQPILDGYTEGDRSASITKLLKEMYGWLNWCGDRGIAVSGSPEDLALEAGLRMPVEAGKSEIDERRIDSIVATIHQNIELFQPACIKRGGDESAWKKIRRLDKATFEAQCPSDIRQRIESEFGGRQATAKQGNRRMKVITQPQQAKQQTSGIIPAKTDKYGELCVPKASTAAAALVEAYRQKLAFNVETDQFYRYSAEVEGVWSVEHKLFVEQIVQAELDASGLQDCYSAGYVASVVSLLQGRLAVRHWNQAAGLLPMQNGVLDLATLELRPHSPGYRLTWQLPYSYDPSAKCEPIQQWMLEAQDGDAKRVQLLRAYLKAIVCGRTDLQRFAECLGPGGTGKSTYVRLATALVGTQNTFTTELKQLESNRFETSGIFGKRLVVITDSDRYGGAVSVLKALTGQDMIRYEQKFRQQGSGFVADAMVIIAANEAIQSSDYTSGLARRRMQIPFLHEVAPDKRRDLLTIKPSGASGEFAPHLAGLLNWVLAMPDEEMRSLIVDTQASIPSLADWKTDGLLKSNPLAEWVDECLVLNPQAKTNVGKAVELRETISDGGNRSISRKQYDRSDKWLYANYVQYSEFVGNKPVSGKRFGDLLEDLLRSQLGVKVTRGRNNSGAYFEGIEIRAEQHDHIGRTISGNPVMDCDGSVMGCDGSVMAETRASDGCDGCDGFFKSSPTSVNQHNVAVAHQPPAHTENCTTKNRELNRARNPSHPSHPSPTRGSAVTNPSQKSVRPITQADGSCGLPPDRNAQYVDLIREFGSGKAAKQPPPIQAGAVQRSLRKGDRVDYVGSDETLGSWNGSVVDEIRADGKITVTHPKRLKARSFEPSDLKRIS